MKEWDEAQKMLEAFTTHELLSNIPVQIESICTYEDRLLVGTKQVVIFRPSFQFLHDFLKIILLYRIENFWTV